MSKIISKYKILIFILFLASLLRFGNLGHPKAYIFDEVYHAFTAREYMTGNIDAWEWWTTPPPGVAYEWTHPPVAKYGMVLGMKIFGNNEYGYRSGSALFGVLSILGIYLFTQAVTKNKSLALLSAFLVTIEGTHIAQSRIAMNDMYMLNFFIWSMLLAVKKNWKLAAILYGLALGSKWSALYGVIPLAVVYLHQNWTLFRTSPRSLIIYLLHPLRYLLIAVATYILTFTPFITTGHTWEQWWELHRQMWYYHTHLVATHGYQSTPLQWIFGARPVWYWVEYGSNQLSNIYVQGNPLILWTGLVALILGVKGLFKYPYSLFYILYAIFVLPWIFSPRIMFYYHYLPSATFLCIILANWLITFPKKYLQLSLLLFTISLLLMSPVLYGYPLPTSYWDRLFSFFPTWK